MASAWKLEAAVSQDGTTALLPGRQGKTLRKEGRKKETKGGREEKGRVQRE